MSLPGHEPLDPRAGAVETPTVAPTLTLVPPPRLGGLLAERRASSGRSLAEVAAGSPFDEVDLAGVEAGSTLLDDGTLSDLLEAYGVQPDDLVPRRGQVVVDLDGGQLLVAERTAALDPRALTADELLSAYLSLVHALRRTIPGSPLVLRQYDVAVLARALRLAEPDVEARLVDLMARPTAELGRLHDVVRRRLLLGVVGVVVLATAVGTVLVLRTDRSTEVPSPAARPGAIEAPLSTEASVLDGPPTLTRDLDGTPGVVVTE